MHLGFFLRLPPCIVVYHAGSFSLCEKINLSFFSRDSGEPFSLSNGSCEMILFRNSQGEIIRVCMGIFTTALKNKKISQILNENTSPYFHSTLPVIWPLTPLKGIHFSELYISRFSTRIRKAFLICKYDCVPVWSSNDIWTAGRQIEFAFFVTLLQILLPQFVGYLKYLTVNYLFFVNGPKTGLFKFLWTFVAFTVRGQDCLRNDASFFF